MLKKSLLLTLFFTGFFYLAPKAFAQVTSPYPLCNMARVANVIYAKTSTQSYAYYIAVLVRNPVNGTAEGLQYALPNFASHTGVTQIETKPIFSPTDNYIYTTVMVKSSSPFPALPNIPPSNTAISVFNHALIRENLVMTRCERPGKEASDMLYRFVAGRSYEIQRSPDLSPGSWQTLEMINTYSDQDLYFWRPMAYMRANSSLPTEFYRVKPVCGDPNECRDHVQYLEQSSNAMRKDYNL